MDIRLLIIAVALAVAGGACGDALRPEDIASPDLPVPRQLVLARTDMTAFDPWRRTQRPGHGALAAEPTIGEASLMSAPNNPGQLKGAATSPNDMRVFRSGL